MDPVWKNEYIKAFVSPYNNPEQKIHRPKDTPFCPDLHIKIHVQILQTECLAQIGEHFLTCIYQVNMTFLKFTAAQ